jgi:hypothetical protein
VNGEPCSLTKTKGDGLLSAAGAAAPAARETEYSAGQTNSDPVRSSSDPRRPSVGSEIERIVRTFFLNSNGLNVVEPNESTHADAPAGMVVNLANWSDAHMTSLAPHEPEPTEIVVILESKH